VIHAVERLGSFLTRKVGDLKKYQTELEKLASNSALAEEVPRRSRGILTPFSELFALVREARNDAVHQGAFARHLTAHAIELALILEDALRSSEMPQISDYMVRNPVCAELWQPIGFVRQQMLASSFSFLPVFNHDGRQWCLVSDRAIATYLGVSSDERKKRLAVTLADAQLQLERAKCVEEDTSLEDALRALDAAPLLVCDKYDASRLLGLVTAFDLL
jgi:CBS domain-containing protein